MLKKNKLRYNEYYDMQHIYDELYAQSKNGNNFYKLLEIIGSEQNICLAYRNLKSNSGSKTAGTDGMTIDDIKQLSNAEIVATVRESLSNYRPKSVRRVFIPKAGSDKMRPLGIPCIWDRLVQQCILQQGNCYVMNRRGTPSTLICIHKSDKGDNLDRYSNLAFVEIPIAKAILTESADEAKSLLKGYVLNSQQKKKLNRIRTNYGYQTITGK